MLIIAETAYWWWSHEYCQHPVGSSPLLVLFFVIRRNIRTGEGPLQQSRWFRNSHQRSESRGVKTFVLLPWLYLHKHVQIWNTGCGNPVSTWHEPLSRSILPVLQNSDHRQWFKLPIRLLKSKTFKKFQIDKYPGKRIISKNNRLTFYPLWNNHCSLFFFLFSLSPIFSHHKLSTGSECQSIFALSMHRSYYCKLFPRMISLSNHAAERMTGVPAILICCIWVSMVQLTSTVLPTSPGADCKNQEL